MYNVYVCVDPIINLLHIIAIILIVLCFRFSTKESAAHAIVGVHNTEVCVTIFHLITIISLKIVKSWLGAFVYL